MTSRPKHLFRALAILLLIAGTVSLQAASLLSNHSTDHATHCCGVCHAVHVALSNPAQALSVFAPVVTAWYVVFEEFSTCREAAADAGHSRAPPA